MQTAAANAPHISLRYETRDWVSIEGLHGAATGKFLRANLGHFDQVYFNSAAHARLALKVQRIPAFIAHAAEHGVIAAYTDR